MNGHKIEYVLSLTPGIQDLFCGFISPDIPLPPITSVPAVFVANTAISTSIGEHWCVLCIEGGGKGYFFDSFGSSPYEYGFYDFINHCQKEIKCNNRIIQDYFSGTCGHHCLYFCIKYGNGILTDKIINTYHNNQKRNDRMVFNFVRDNYGEIIARI